MAIRPLVVKPDARLEAAANWVLRLQEGNASDETVAAWLAWCEADDRNRQAFDRMAGMWDVAGDLSVSDAEWSVAAAADAGIQGETDGAPLSAGPRRWPALAAAAALVLVAAAALLVMTLSGPRSGQDALRVARFETPIGETQATLLADGSKMKLGGDTSLTVRYTPEARTIVAERGEMFFKVAKNPDRPFVVEAGPLTATAVGTAFSVERSGETVSVVVTEGIVEVRTLPSIGPSIGPNGGPGGAAQAARTLRAVAGERIRFDRGELAQTGISPGLDLAKAWHGGPLEFRDEPLRLVVARINRYSDVQLRISDPSIADLRLTTSVDKNSLDNWLAGIQAILPVRIAREGGKAVVISPAV